MISNVVLRFSPTNEKTPYEQGENRTVILFSRQPRDRQFINFLNVPPHGPSLKEYEWVYCELYVWFRSVKDLILHGNRKKKSLKTVNRHREGIYTSFKLELSGLTEVVQWIEQPRSQSSSAISDVTSPVKLVGKISQGRLLLSRSVPSHHL